MILCGYCLEKVNELHTKHSCEAIGALKKKFNTALLEIQNDFERELKKVNQKIDKVVAKINCENVSRGHGFGLNGGECISCFTVQVKSEPLTKQQVNAIVKYNQEMQENIDIVTFWYTQADQLKAKVQEMEMCLGKEKEDYKHLLSLFDDLKQNYEILKSNHSRLIAASPRNERLVREWEREESNNHNGGCCL